MIRNRII